MILLKANSELNHIFSRMLKTMDVNVVWTGNIVVLNNFLILSGKVRSLIFNFDNRKIITNVIELPDKEEDMDPVADNQTLTNVLNMTLYAFGKWGAIRGLKVDKDYSQLNALFYAILKDMRIIPGYRDDNFRFYRDNIQMTFEEVVQAAREEGKRKPQEEVKEEKQEEEKEEKGLGLWHNVRWSLTKSSFHKSEISAYERKASRIGNNFYINGYQCPECARKLYMAIYPQGKEFPVETEEGRVYLARSYTCDNCNLFYTPRPGRLLREGENYVMKFGGDRDAYEDYRELLGRNAERTSNCNFNEFASKRGKHAMPPIEEVCADMEHMSEEELHDIEEKIDENFFPIMQAELFREKIQELLKARKEAKEGKKKKQEAAPAGNQPEGSGADTAGKSAHGADPESVGKSVKGSGAKDPGESAEGSDAELAGKSALGMRTDSMGKSVKGTEAESAGKSAQGVGAESAGKSAKNLGAESAGKSAEDSGADYAGRTSDSSGKEVPGESAQGLAAESSLQNSAAESAGNPLQDSEAGGQQPGHFGGEASGKSEKKKGFFGRRNAKEKPGRGDFANETSGKEAGLLNEVQDTGKALGTDPKDPNGIEAELEAEFAESNGTMSIKEKYDARMRKLDRMSMWQLRRLREQVRDDERLDWVDKEKYEKLLRQAVYQKGAEEVRKKAEYAMTQSYAVIKRVMEEIAQAECPELIKKEMLEALEEVKKKRGQEEAAELIARVPETMTRSQYHIFREKLNQYDGEDVSVYNEVLEGARRLTEKREIAGMLKRAAGADRRGLIQMLTKLREDGFLPEQAEPAIKEIEGRVMEMDQKVIDKICPNIPLMSFDDAASAYEKIEGGVFLPEIKTNTLEMIDKRLTKLKMDECGLLVEKLRDALSAKITDADRLHFYEPRKVMRGDWAPREAELAARALNTYAQERDRYEYPILICDSSAKKNGREGFILTPDHIFYNSMFSSEMIPIRSITGIEGNTGLLSKGIYVKRGNGKKTKIPGGISSKELKEFGEILEEFVSYLQEKPESRSIAYLSKEKHDVKCCYRCGYTYRGGNTCPKCGNQANQ